MLWITETSFELLIILPLSWELGLQVYATTFSVNLVVNHYTQILRWQLALFAFYMGGVLTLSLAICKLLRVQQLSFCRTVGDRSFFLATEQYLFGTILMFLTGIKVRTGTLQTQTKILKVKVLIYDFVVRKEMHQTQREPFHGEIIGEVRQGGGGAGLGVLTQILEN